MSNVVQYPGECSSIIGGSRCNEDWGQRLHGTEVERPLAHPERLGAAVWVAELVRGPVRGGSWVNTGVVLTGGDVRFQLWREDARLDSERGGVWLESKDLPLLARSGLS